MRFVDVILPLTLQSVYTYILPEEWQNAVMPGFRVIVPFGVRKFYTAVVAEVHERQPEGYVVKAVYEVLDTAPVLLPFQLTFWRWLADYNLCTVGDVYKAALPSGMKLESESRVVLNDEFTGSEVLTEREQQLVSLLSGRKDASLTQLQKECGGGKVLRVVNSLLDKGVLCMDEKLRHGYRPRTETHIRLTPSFFKEDRLHEVLDDLKRAVRQQSLLLKYLELSDAGAALRLQNPGLLAEVSRKKLVEAAGSSMQACRVLESKGILESYPYETGRLRSTEVTDTVGLSPLSEEQQRAYLQIGETFKRYPVCLLHGVTSSGKTEVYIHLINRIMAEGRQVLYLVPEIVLTTQLTDRLYRVFGSRMGVYHSKFSDAERVEIWQKQLSDHPYDIIVGVRSSVFLPFRRLGLVIVDEEHEQSYKQQDPAPRYHARNSAIVLARLCGAHTLLGTATPALETYHNVSTGKYGLVKLTGRYGNVRLPEVEVVDIRELQHKRRMHGPFSPRLLEAMRMALENKEQVILFQNRRGYAPMIECRACGWVPKCKNCDVSLTYHKGLNKMTCHYCGFTCQMPAQCPACEGEELMQLGFGTEKIEALVHEIFPHVSVARMDLDTTRSRSAYEGILRGFQEGKTDVLIGTQMVTKGLDFDRVSVVGILNADAMFNLPDFRSYERAFQLMAQVAGRAGRRSRQGLVVLQTKSPELALVSQVREHDYAGLYTQQMEERQMFTFPPFCRLIYVYMKHRQVDTLDRLAAEAGVRLRAVFGSRILGPDAPPVSRIQLLYIRKIVIKVEPGASLSLVRGHLLRIREELLAHPDYRSAQIYFDVDPV